MVGRSLPVIAALVLLSTSGARAQGRDQGQQDLQALEMQKEIEHYMQTRSPEAEAAGREWLKKIAPNLMPMLDSLHQKAREEYWMEIAQLVAQMHMVGNIAYYKDSARADVVARMFAVEANARVQQRAYRDGSEAARPKIRAKIEALITQHFDLEEQLRTLEVADIERRLADVRAENQRRRDNRAELIKSAVDDIVKDALLHSR